MSTGTAAHAWAAEGAPAGALVVADRQLSPRGHAGRPLTDPAVEGLGFSLVMRPSLSAAREGWIYTLVLTALADALGGGTTLAWPDEVRRDGRTVAAVGVQTRPDEDGKGIRWAIADVVLAEAERPRGPMLRAVLEAIDARAAGEAAVVTRDYESACETIGRQVRARLRAGTGPSLEGRAVATLDDGAIVLETRTGSRAPVRPHDVRGLEPL